MAMIMCMIMVVASMCMITSATVFSAEEKADTVTDEISEGKAETEESSTTVETTVVTLETAEETTTTKAETTTLEDVGAAIRKDLKVKVRDVIYFDDGGYLCDVDGNWRRTKSGWNIWIVGIDDKNQRFRVDVPKMRNEENKVFYLLYADTEDAIGVSHQGYVVGDLDYDGKVNAKDFTLLKRILMYGEDDKILNLMSDWNADQKVDMSDLVLMQRWLLCEK